MQLPRFLAAVAGATRSPPAGRAEWPLRWLLAATIVLPLIGFAVAAIISYRGHMADARDRLERTLNSVHEHALKVFETIELTARYLDEMLSDVSDRDIRAAESIFHARLKGVIDTLPQLADVWIIDREGHPVVAGTVFPMPPLNLADREYFQVHRENLVQGPFIGEVVRARATNAQGQPRFFTLSRRRGAPNGGFAGVTTISISPDYFTDYYSRLPPPAIAALVRDDGAILARHPEVSNEVARVPADGAFMQAKRHSPERGSFDVVASPFDGAERLYVYRKVPRHGVYVVTGIDKAAITGMWLDDLSRHLIFGIPATLAMFGLGVVALRRTRREAAAYQQLRQETERREITEQALRQAQKMEAVGRLTGGIAHDFNNLLTAILGNIDLALRRLKGETEADDRIVRSLSAARRASERAASLVGRLLAFSRQHPLEVKSVDVNRLVQGMSELLRQTLGETVKVETVLAGGMWKSAVDPNQLENAILNLAVNSRDAMPDGGRLTLETANASLDEVYAAEAGGDFAPGQYAMVAVSDTGTGMSNDVIERAIEPFFTTKPTGAGSGLGLSMVYGFVKQSGGHFRIYSEPGEGTSVKLYFPRLTDASAVPDWPTEAVRSDDAPRSLQHETILLVEDDEQVNRFACEALRDRGYRVLPAPDGETALRLLDGEPSVDLLFTDVVLPGGMNGRQLADEVRRRRPAVKVLYATGYTRNAIIHQGRLDSDVDLLSKPFTADALTRKVRQILDGGSSRVRANEAAG
jgi:two-component system NtrC family sensor kinase